MKSAFRKWVSSQWKNKKIKKSIIFIILTSTIFPLIVPIISNILIFNPRPGSLLWTIDYESRIPTFTEFSLAEISLLYIIIRFIPLLILGYFNGLLLNKIKIKYENGYLFSSSIIIYILSVELLFHAILFLDKIPIFSYIFSLFDFFNF